MITSLATFIVPKSGLLRPVLNVAIGWGVPLVVTAIAFAVTYDDYGTGGCQWVNRCSYAPVLCPTVEVLLVEA